MSKSKMVFKAEAENGFKVALNATNFYPSDREKLEEATKWIAKALGSDEFMDFCLNFSYTLKTYTGRLWWKKCHINEYHEFEDNDGYSNEEIYHIIMSGQERLSEDGKDGEADIYQVLDRRSNRRVLGYTYANSTSQWIYNNFFSNGTVADVAGNIVHEWVHKMGFTHDYKYTSSRRYSVPYAVGYFVRDYIDRNFLGL